ncbi:hypothetical protein [Streptomyces noursei]|uniref:hypothetical protein n=1 Tax=Streptomyces noursei TaxID=1971 RepID=UPI0038058B69
MTIEIPPPPTAPPTVHLADQQQEPVDAPADTEMDTAAPAPERPAHRIQNWWSGRHVDLTKPAPAADENEDQVEEDEDQAVEEGEGECAHPALVPLVLTTGETVGYLCRDCDARLYAKADKDADEDEDGDEEEADGDERPGRRAALRKAAGWLPAGATGITLNPRARRVVYNATAAGLGWLVGIGPLASDALRDCGAHYDMSTALILGCLMAGGVAFLFDRRTRVLWAPLAWACRAPLASVVLAIALYAPTH